MRNPFTEQGKGENTKSVFIGSDHIKLQPSNKLIDRMFGQEKGSKEKILKIFAYTADRVSTEKAW